MVPPNEGESLTLLVRAAQGGDRGAFGRLYQRHRRVVNAVLLGLVEPDEVPDLLHDVFLIALRELAQLREPEAFPGWLRMIARNEAKMHLRTRRPVELLSETVAADVEPVDARLEAQRVMTCIQSLPDRLREPLLLRLVQGLSGEEIAEQLELTHGTVRVYLHEGMTLLRVRLGEKEHRDER
ncbi:MAG: sigma-70 family RNA polymerase sigma factor [Gemmatimonadaceae bacterium]|nr:sigma-70 family RNA polymerase sigma factor [Gemmatimonadaceae bacterium]